MHLNVWRFSILLLILSCAQTSVMAQGGPAARFEPLLQNLEIVISSHNQLQSDLELQRNNVVNFPLSVTLTPPEQIERLLAFITLLNQSEDIIEDASGESQALLTIITASLRGANPYQSVRPLRRLLRNTRNSALLQLNNTLTVTSATEVEYDLIESSIIDQIQSVAEESNIETLVALGQGIIDALIQLDAAIATVEDTLENVQTNVASIRQVLIGINEPGLTPPFSDFLILFIGQTAPTTTTTLAPTTAPVPITPPPAGGPLFEEMLFQLLTADIELNQLASTTRSQVLQFEGFTATLPLLAESSIAEIQTLINLLISSETLVSQSQLTVQTLLTDIQDASVSAEPYIEQSELLGASLVSAQEVSLEVISELTEATTDISAEFGAAISILNTQIDNIGNAGFFVALAIATAQEEVTEIAQDSAPLLGEFIAAIEAAISANRMSIDDVQQRLQAITSPDPLFTTFIQQFLAFIVTTTPVPTTTTTLAPGVTSTTPGVAPTLGPAPPPPTGGPDFEQLLFQISLADLEIRVIVQDSQLEQSRLQGLSSTPQADPNAQIAEIRAIVAELTLTQQAVDLSLARAETLSTGIQSTSQSADPYTSQSETLANTLKDAQEKGIDLFGKIVEAAEKASSLFTEIISDVSMQISNIEGASFADLPGALSEAQDELAEATSSSASEIGELIKSGEEALADTEMRISDIQASLEAITQPSQPPFTTFTQQFIAGTALP